MRRLLTICLLASSLVFSCAAGLAAPAALAAGYPGGTVSTNSLTGSPSGSQPGFGLTSGGAVTTPQVQTAPPPTTTSSASGGLSGLDGVIIAVVAFLVLGGIALYIWYDARGHAVRIGHGDDAMFGQRAHAGSKPPRKQRKLTPAERRRRKRGRAR
jgi:hypothetical protein